MNMNKVGLRVFSGIVLVGILLFTALGLAMSRGRQLDTVYSPSGFSESFDFSSGSFEDYILWSERRVRASRTDSPSEATISNLLPFELKPDADCPVNSDGRYPDGIVLVHGLIASPWSMKPLGEYFQSRCFHVLGVLLPGHGTRVGDMLDSTWEEWQEHVHFATQRLAERVDRVYVSGHSTGGTMAVLEGTRNPAVDALILFAPAMMVVEASRYAGLVSLVGEIFPGAAWFEFEPEDAVYRYESFPYTTAAQT